MGLHGRAAALVVGLRPGLRLMEWLPIVSTILGVLTTFISGMVMATLTGLRRDAASSETRLSLQISKLDDRLLAHVTSSDLHDRGKPVSTR